MSETLTSEELTGEPVTAEICIRMQTEPRFTFDEWLAEGKELARRKKELIAGTWQLQFDIGDWLIKCENYRAGEELTGYSASTLRTFVYVARHVPFHIRNANLPWGIHQLVAPLQSDEDKALFLQAATKKEWSVSDARAVLQNAQANGHLKSGVVPKSGRDYTSQNAWDYRRNLERGQGRKETTQDEIDVDISAERLRRTIDEMRRWKIYPVDDDDLSRAVPLLSSVNKAAVIKRLRSAAQELLNMAERMEAIEPSQPPGKSA